MDDDEHNAQGGGHTNSSMALSKHRGNLQARVACNSHNSLEPCRKWPSYTAPRSWVFGA